MSQVFVQSFVIVVQWFEIWLFLVRFLSPDDDGLVRVSVGLVFEFVEVGFRVIFVGFVLVQDHGKLLVFWMPEILVVYLLAHMIL